MDDVLATLDPDQRAAACLPDGPAQIVAPAGSGKTTTLVARLGVLLARGVPPEAIAVVTFNREAAAELAARIASQLGARFPGAERIEVRTLHAMARQVLLDAGGIGELVADRAPLLRAAGRRVIRQHPESAPPPDADALDAHLSRWKVEGISPPDVARPALDAYAELIADRGAIDFDDLVSGAAYRLEQDAALRARWQARFSHLAVDEFQDVDAAQLRLVRVLAGARANLFVVGDDDQTIYAWRLADVRRILGFRDWYPAARRVILATNYRCPPEVVAAGRRLVEHNLERFAKPIRAGRDGPTEAIGAVATGGAGWPEQLVHLVRAEAEAGRRACLLARTRSELTPLILALVHAGVPHTTPVQLPIDAEPVVALLAALERRAGPGHPFPILRRLRREQGWDRASPDDSLGVDDHAALDALLGWAADAHDAPSLLRGTLAMRARLAELRQPDAAVELLTAHGAKGREWPLVILVGWEADRFPNRRALRDAIDPVRAMEEERRLAYVAVTRATRRLLLAFDPARPSPFLAEMGYSPTSAASALR
jgi:DNA helicase-2/ATP-dependent DNA helicase PcrA